MKAYFRLGLLSALLLAAIATTPLSATSVCWTWACACAYQGDCQGPDTLGNPPGNWDDCWCENPMCTEKTCYRLAERIEASCYWSSPTGKWICVSNNY